MALAALRINARNSLLRLAVPVVMGVSIIWSHFSVEVAARRETKPLQNEHQGFLTTAFTHFVFVLCGPSTILSALAVYLNLYNGPMMQKQSSHLTDAENGAQEAMQAHGWRR